MSLASPKWCDLQRSRESSPIPLDVESANLTDDDGYTEAAFTRNPEKWLIDRGTSRKLKSSKEEVLVVLDLGKLESLRMVDSRGPLEYLSNFKVWIGS